jgi:hypothetical protein
MIWSLAGRAGVVQAEQVREHALGVDLGPPGGQGVVGREGLAGAGVGRDGGPALRLVAGRVGRRGH